MSRLDVTPEGMQEPYIGPPDPDSALHVSAWWAAFWYWSGALGSLPYDEDGERLALAMSRADRTWQNWIDAGETSCLATHSINFYWDASRIEESREHWRKRRERFDQRIRELAR